VALTKIDIIKKIVDQIGMSKKDSVDIVESVLSIIKSTLEAGEDVKIAGFGKFEIKQKHERRGRNPQTGKLLMLCPRKIVSFKLSNKLNAQINGD